MTPCPRAKRCRRRAFSPPERAMVVSARALPTLIGSPAVWCPALGQTDLRCPRRRRSASDRRCHAPDLPRDRRARVDRRRVSAPRGWPGRRRRAGRGVAPGGGSSLEAHQDAGASADQDTIFRAARSEYALGEADELVVPLTWTDASGVSIEKRFVLARGSYAVRVEQTLVNNSEQPWRGDQYTQLLRRSKTSMQ